ncbi:MAG: glycoside hydrolase, partial [Actinobacteria bacterium]|nr:glycoside hydrolase [Actinomycetota bacterium]
MTGTGLPKSTINLTSYASMAVDRSGGPYTGAIYVVWTNIGVPGVNVGDADIYVVESTDRGASWSTPVRVNDDATPNAQWFPWIACDQTTGDLSVVFHDQRDDPNDSLATMYVARSTDGGQVWENFRVGDVQFAPRPIPGFVSGYMGDYIGIAAGGGRAYPVWGDWRATPFLSYVSPVAYPASSSDANIVVSESVLRDTLLESSSASRTFTIRNHGVGLDPLTFSIAESPAVSWASVAPTGGTLASGETAVIARQLSSSGLPVGAHSTTLVITSDDPDDPTVPLPLDLEVLPAPQMALDRFHLNHVIPVGENATDGYMITNAGDGVLDYSVAVAYESGPHEVREEIGSPLLTTTAACRCRGNVYSVSAATHLVTIETYFSLAAATDVEFVVYEGAASTGAFAKVYSSGTVTRGPGVGFFASPPIGIALEAGTFYFIGSAWRE